MRSLLNFQTPGDRLRAVRAYCSPSRNDFCSKTNISESTLKAWENDVAPLTRKGAVLLSKIFVDFNIHCTVEWLLEGKEPSPLRPFEGSLHAMVDESVFIEKEFARLKDYYKTDLCLYKVPDGYMAPFFKSGDCIAGLTIPPSETPYYWEEVVLIETHHGELLLRKILKGNQPGLLTLITLDLPENHPQHKVENIEIKKAYRIIWHRAFLNPLKNPQAKPRAISDTF